MKNIVKKGIVGAVVAALAVGVTPAVHASASAQAPTDVSAAPNGSLIQLNFSESPDADVYRATCVSRPLFRWMDPQRLTATGKIGVINVSGARMLTTYTCSVTAVSDGVESRPSEQVAVFVRPIIGPVSNATVIPSAAGAKFTWPAKFGTLATKIQVRKTDDPRSASVTVQVNGFKREAQVNGLAENQDYIAEISAQGATGWGAPSTLAFRTGSPVAARLPGVVFGWSSNTLTDNTAEENSFGVRNGMLSTYVDWASMNSFPTEWADSAATRKASLLISWEPWDSNAGGTEQPNFRPSAITAGSFDTYITNWLKSAENYAKTGAVIVRFAPEMNDSARPWSVGRNGGNTAQNYIDMWNHVYQIKKSVAPNVIFLWNPLNYGSTPMNQVFPGTANVDMLALDGFNWGQTLTTQSCGWQSFDDVFKQAVSDLKALAGSKPWGIAEFASAPSPDDAVFRSGVCYGPWGTWVYEWPENYPYERTASDWITQGGWVEMAMRRAYDQGALFVNLFEHNKETDWRVSQSADGRSRISGLVKQSGWVPGDKNAISVIRSATGL